MTDVLIVDDEEEICEYLCDTLEKIGVSSQFVLTGERALKIIEQETFRVCLVDMKLSTAVKGLEVVKGIRSKLPQAIIAAMSGYIDQELKDTAKRYGISDYLEKPTDLKLDVFGDKIKLLLAKATANTK